MGTFHVFAGAAALLVFALGGEAWGASLEGARAEAPVPPSAEHRLTWTAPRFRPLEYVAAVSVTAVQLSLQLGTAHVPDSRFRGGVLFDDGVRDAIRLEGVGARGRAARVSDVLWLTAMNYPIVVDSLLVPLLFDGGNVDVAFQMLLLDWQAEGLTGLITLGFHRTAGRTRPYMQGCVGAGCEVPEDSGSNASFLSGHTSGALVGAGLTCAHHQALPLYGSSLADAAACGGSRGSCTTESPTWGPTVRWPPSFRRVTRVARALQW